MIKKIKQAAVIGSGIMGSGIAALLASKGIKTLLLDILPPDLEKDEKNFSKRNRIVLDNIEKCKKSKPPVFTTQQDLAFLELGNLEDDFDKLNQCDWIFEAIPENPKLKIELFTKIDKIRKEGSLLSTNTSGIPLKMLSANFSDDLKRHFFGAHFFNPVRYMHLIEIIKSKDTNEEVINFAYNFASNVLGKGIVLAKDTPNFIANRLGVQSLIKSLSLMLKMKIAVHEIDSVLSKFLGRPKSALFRTIDIVGIDTLVFIADNTAKILPSEKDDMNVPDFLRKMVEKKLLGNKTKSGFYKMEKGAKGEKIIKAINPETLEYSTFEEPFFLSFFAAKQAKTNQDKIKAICAGDDNGALFAWEMLYNEITYAAERVPEIADNILEIDKAMKWGYNFKLGPFESWDALGLVDSVKRMQKEGKKVPENVLNMIKKGHTSFYKPAENLYYDFTTESYKEIPRNKKEISLGFLRGQKKIVQSCKSASLIDLGDGVFCCEFHTKMNSLNGELILFMNGLIEFIENNGRGLVIGNENFGSPGAFSAGADIFYVMNLIKEKNFKAIDEFVATGQGVIQRLKYTSFPIVAAPFDLTLGGGCEVCLGVADRIIAHSELYMGLVEVGVGLVPAGGGCLNLWKKFLSSIPKNALKDFDFAKLFIPVFMNIATAQVSSSAANARELGFLGPNDRIVANKTQLISEAKREVLYLADGNYTPPAKVPIPVIGESGYGMVASEIFNKLQGGFLSEHDALVAKNAAFVISGGSVKEGTLVSEDTILALERNAFVELCKTEKTFLRIAHTLQTGKPLRN